VFVLIWSSLSEVWQLNITSAFIVVFVYACWNCLWVESSVYICLYRFIPSVCLTRISPTSSVGLTRIVNLLDSYIEPFQVHKVEWKPHYVTLSERHTWNSLHLRTRCGTGSLFNTTHWLIANHSVRNRFVSAVEAVSITQTYRFMRKNCWTPFATVNFLLSDHKLHEQRKINWQILSKQPLKVVIIISST